MKFEEFYQEQCGHWTPLDVGNVARRWERALQLTATYGVTPTGGAYSVPSQSGSGKLYVVAFSQAGAPSCTCPDASKETARSAPWGWCKHALAALMLSRNGKGSGQAQPEYQEPEEPPDPADLADPQERPATAPYRASRCPLAGHRQPNRGRYGLYCPTPVGDGWCKWTDKPRKEKAA